MSERESAHDRVIGREDELLALESFVADPGPRMAFLLGGEPGIGKTTLWERGVARARGCGATVLEARGSQAETRLSFSALIDLFDGVDFAPLRDLPEPHAAESSRDRMTHTGTGTQYAGMASMALAEGLLGTGDIWGALRAAREAVAAAVQRGAKTSVARSRVTLGRALLAVGDLAECEGQLRMALEAAGGRKRATTPRAYETLAALSDARSDEPGRISFLQLALRDYRNGGATIHRRRVERLLAYLQNGSDRP